MDKLFFLNQQNTWQEKIGTNLARNNASVTKKSELNFNNYFIPDFLNFGRAPDFSKIGQWDHGIIEHSTL